MLTMLGQIDNVLQKEIFGNIDTGKLTVVGFNNGGKFRNPWSLLGLSDAHNECCFMVWEKKTVVIIDNSSVHRSEESEEKIPKWKKEIVYQIFTRIFSRTESDKKFYCVS